MQETQEMWIGNWLQFSYLENSIPWAEETGRLQSKGFQSQTQLSDSVHTQYGRQ